MQLLLNEMGLHLGVSPVSHSAFSQNRLRIETFFGILKTRLDLENFTGKSAESVYQDFYSSVYLTGF